MDLVVKVSLFEIQNSHLAIRLSRMRFIAKITQIPWLIKRSNKYEVVNKIILFIGLMMSILAIAISANQIMAQNVTTNASNVAGNMTGTSNQTASELGQNASSLLNNAGEKVGSALGEVKQNVSNVGTELGQNASNVGTDILNQTEEALKKAGTGAADVLSNISGEIKEGINGSK